MKAIDWLRRNPRYPNIVFGFVLLASGVEKTLNVAGNAETAVTLFGLCRSVLAHPFFPLLAFLVFLVFLDWPQIKRRFSAIPFSVRPWCASIGWYANDPVQLAKQKFTAFLAVKNTSGRTLHKCSVRLIDAAPLIFGGVMDAYQAGPNLSADRGDSFFLGWAEQEAASADRRFLDIPPDNTERIAEILVLNVSESCANFAAANPNDLTNKLDRIKSWWWKLRIKIAAEDGAHVDTEWLAACGKEPGPIIIRAWEKNGDEILKLQREGKIERW